MRASISTDALPYLVSTLASLANAHPEVEAHAVYGRESVIHLDGPEWAVEEVRDELLDIMTELGAVVVARGGEA